MPTLSTRRLRKALAVLTITATLTLTGCSGEDPLGGGASSPGAAGPTLVIGSQAYYSNEIIAEIYAQALEEAGFSVDRQFQIGQREVYMPEIVAGDIDVFPEYSGNLLQYFDPTTTARTRTEVSAALSQALPAGLRVLDDADASDQDSYVVTSSFSSQHAASSIGDLAGISGLVLGGNSELESRPYGPSGLRDVYGVSVAFTPIEDSGGPLTLKALRDDQVQLVNIFSADPVLSAADLVVLADPKGLFLASHVVPVVSTRVNDEAVRVLNAVQAALGADDLVAMNAASVTEQSPAATIARTWLAQQNLG